MTGLVLFILMNCITFTIKSQWISPDSTLFRADRLMATGSVNSTIYIIGGWDYPRQITTYNIRNDTFEDVGANILTGNVYGSSQFYAQQRHLLYMIRPDANKLDLYDMETKEFITNWMNITLDQHIRSYDGCLALTSDYFVIIDGESRSVQILNVSTYEWVNNVSRLNEQRGWFSCIVEPSTDTVYAIGGYISSSIRTLKTIETINIEEIQRKEWSYIDNLTVPTQRARSVLYENTIFVVGGHDGNGYMDIVQLIDTKTGKVTQSGDRLAYNIGSAAVVLVDTVIYAFGGSNGTIYVDKWMYYILPSPSPSTSPTAVPSTSPTAVPSTSPTDPSSSPTAAPSTSPIAAPSPSPTAAPSPSPTVDPSNGPITNTSTTTTPSSMFEESPSTTSDPTNEASMFEDSPSSTTLSLNTSLNIPQIDSKIAEIPSLFISFGIIGTFLLFAIISLIDAKWIRQNDYFKIKPVVISGLEVCDTILDVLFAVLLTEYYLLNGDIAFLVSMIASYIFIFVPIIFSIYQLWNKMSSEWIKDDFLRQWLTEYSKILYLLSIFCGSSYTSVSMVNCGAFQLDVFEMNLTKYQQLTFSINRIYGTVLLENIPQIIIQVWYLVVIERDFLPILSIGFSFISIISSLLSLLTQRQIAERQQFVKIRFDIIGNDITPKLGVKTNGIRSKLSKVIGINPKLMEIPKPRHTVNGLKMDILLYINYIIYKDINYKTQINDAVDNGKLIDLIKEEWNINTTIKIENLNFEDIESKQQQKNTVIIKQNVEMMVNENKLMNININNIPIPGMIEDPLENMETKRFESVEESEESEGEIATNNTKQ